MAMLTGNMLKLIAAFSMLLDHMGMLLFPHQIWFRIAGRLAFPIFAYMIAEGCHYTRNRKRYWGLITALAVVYQIVYLIVDGTLYFSVLVTFSLSILTIYALDHVKTHPGMASAVVFSGSVVILWMLNRLFTIDYGFWGCMLPVFASLPRRTPYDRPGIGLLCLALGLLLLSLDFGGIQMYSLLSLPILLCYSGRRGKWNLKYFFYIFYPTHLVVLYLIQLLM